MPRGKRTVNKSAFVRNLPLSMSAAEVVAKGKAEGIALSDKYVYNIRAKDKSRGGKPVGKPGRRPGRPKGSGATRGAGSAEQQLVELALQIGLERTEAVLTKLRDAIRRAIAG
jgi:hypothetical protein